MNFLGRASLANSGWLPASRKHKGRISGTVFLIERVRELKFPTLEAITILTIEGELQHWRNIQPACLYGSNGVVIRMDMNDLMRAEQPPEDRALFTEARLGIEVIQIMKFDDQHTEATEKSV